jgi:hypothetical protein
VFIGHAKQINDAVYSDGKLWTVGSEGVLVWNFLAPAEQFLHPPIFSK